jgi:hypothetical protein
MFGRNKKDRRKKNKMKVRRGGGVTEERERKVFSIISCRYFRGQLKSKVFRGGVEKDPFKSRVARSYIYFQSKIWVNIGGP